MKVGMRMYRRSVGAPRTEAGRCCCLGLPMETLLYSGSLKSGLATASPPALRSSGRDFRDCGSPVCTHTWSTVIASLCLCWIATNRDSLACRGQRARLQAILGLELDEPMNPKPARLKNPSTPKT